MSTTEKLYQRIMQKPYRSDITPSEMQKFLRDKDFVHKNTKGDDYFFGHEKLSYLLKIPMACKQLLTVYVRNVQKAMEEIGGEEDDEI